MKFFDEWCLEELDGDLDYCRIVIDGTDFFDQRVCSRTIISIEETSDCCIKTVKTFNPELKPLPLEETDDVDSLPLVVEYHLKRFSVDCEIFQDFFYLFTESPEEDPDVIVYDSDTLYRFEGYLDGVRYRKKNHGFELPPMLRQFIADKFLN